MTTAFAGYRTGTPAARATVVSVIVAVHGLAVGALLSLGGMEVLRETQPLLVELIDAPRPRPIEIPRPVPMPNMRPPELHLNIPPPPENLYAVRMEPQVPPSAPVIAAVAPVVSAPPAPAPSLEPPRADMAYLNNPAPAYPSVSKRAGEQGRVLLKVRVDPRGEVEEVQVQATSGFPRLDQAALTAVRRWRFAPARIGERAVAGWAIVPVNFTLRG